MNDTVWNAVKQCIERPELIAAGIRIVVQSNQRNTESQAGHNKRALEQIRIEETRIVQAYRLGFLDAEQLGTELKALKARRSLIKQPEPTREVKVGIDQLRLSLVRYRERISQRLDVLAQEKKREILQHLLIKVVFEGTKVKIVGRLPIANNKVQDLHKQKGLYPVASNNSVAEGNHSVQSTTEPLNSSAALGIEDTTLSSYARNADSVGGTTSWSCALNAPNQMERSGEITFELVTEVQRDRTAAIIASRSNLRKASAARWKGNQG